MADGNFLKIVRFSNPVKVAISQKPEARSKQKKQKQNKQINNNTTQ